MKGDMMEKTTFTIDEAIHKAGGFGKYQIIQILLLSSTLLITAIPVLTMYFVAYNPPWQCVSNTSCTLNGTYSSGVDEYALRCKLSRDEWEYTSPPGYSLVTQFDLYCDDEWIASLLKSIIFVGWAFGAIIFGELADRFGRKKVLVTSIFGIFFCSVGMAFATNVWIVVVLQGLRGVFRPGASVNAFILASEIVGHRWRPHSGIAIFFAWTVSICLLGLKAYLIREWKKLILVCTLPYIPVLVVVFFIPESMRWLRLNDRENEAVSLLKKMGKINRKPLGNIKLTSVEVDCNSRNTYLDILRPMKTLVRSVIQWFSWFTIAMVYYGITFASDDLGGSMYRDYILSSLIEAPAVCFAIYFCHRFGRKRTISYPMFVSAAVLIIVSLIPEDSDAKWVRVVFGMIGKFSITVSFDAVYTWAVELHPTTMRSKAMGALQVAARVGSAAAPWIAKALRVYHVTIPFIIMGSCSLATGVIMQWLPETKGKKTLETIGDEKCLDSKDDAMLLSNPNSIHVDKTKEEKLLGENGSTQSDDNKQLVV